MSIPLFAAPPTPDSGILVAKSSFSISDAEKRNRRALSCARRSPAEQRNSTSQLFSKFFPVHDRAARSISPSLTILVPSEI
jgi:hypothetical protein